MIATFEIMTRLEDARIGDVNPNIEMMTFDVYEDDSPNPEGTIAIRGSVENDDSSNLEGDFRVELPLSDFLKMANAVVALCGQ
jgi:hypothetical protein